MVSRLLTVAVSNTKPLHVWSQRKEEKNSLNFGRENGKPVFGSGRKVYVAILVDCLVVVSNPAV